MRRLVVVLLVLAGLLVVADRVAAQVAAGQLADHLTGDLGTRPSVQVGGFPFLTQVVRGRYSDLQLSAGPVQRDGVTVAHLSADLSGVGLPLSDALRGRIAAVPVQRLTVHGLLGYAELRQLAHRDVTFSPAPGGAVKVSGRLRVLGQDLDASAVSTLRVSGGVLSLSATDVRVAGLSAPSFLERPLAELLTFTVRLPTFPYGVTLSGLTAGPDGVAVTGAARDVVLQR